MVVNEAATGRSWTFVLPLVFGDIQHIGHFSAGLLMFCMLGGGLIGWKARQERAWRAERV